MMCVLWCYLRNNAFKKDGVDYHTAADLTAQANHLGVTIQADIIKQKLPTTNGGFEALKDYLADDYMLGLLLGRDVLKAVRDRLSAFSASIEEWAPVTKDVNFPS